MAKISIIEDYFAAPDETPALEKKFHTDLTRAKSQLNDLKLFTPVKVIADYFSIAKPHQLTPLLNDVFNYIMDFIEPKQRLIVISLLSKEIYLILNREKAKNDIKQFCEDYLLNNFQETFNKAAVSTLYKHWRSHCRHLADILKVSPLWYQDAKGNFLVGRQNKPAFEYIIKVLLGYHGFYKDLLRNLNQTAYENYRIKWMETVNLLIEILALPDKQLHLFFKSAIEFFEIAQSIDNTIVAVKQLAQHSTNKPKYIKNYIDGLTTLSHHIFALRPNAGGAYLHDVSIPGSAQKSPSKTSLTF